MTRVRLALVLLFGAAAIFLSVVPPAKREREASQREYARVREEGQRLRVRVAATDRRALDEPEARAADGAAAVRALRQAALQATQGVPVSAVEIAASVSTRGAVAGRCRLKVEGRLVDTLRVARRLAAPASGLLLESLSLAAARDEVRLEAEVFMLREGP